MLHDSAECTARASISGNSNGYLTGLLTFSLSVLFMLVGSEHTLVPLSSTLAFIGDATLCPLGNSSVPMKLSAGRKSTGEEEDNAVVGDAFLRLPLSSRLFSLRFFLDCFVAFSSSFDFGQKRISVTQSEKNPNYSLHLRDIKFLLSDRVVYASSIWNLLVNIKYTLIRLDIFLFCVF